MKSALRLYGLLVISALNSAACLEPMVKGIPGRDGLEYVRVPSGEGWLGCTSEPCRQGATRRHFTRTNAFLLGKTEVTVDAYQKFVLDSKMPMPDAPGFNPAWSHRTHPIVNVSALEARAYCSWMGGRLPTEDEWEWAARGGLNQKMYPWGSSLSHDLANYEGTGGRDSWEKTAPVGSFPPNGYGLCDMAGNVSEFVEASPFDFRSIILRGGGWPTSGVGLNMWLGMPADSDYSARSAGFRCLLPHTD